VNRRAGLVAAGVGVFGFGVGAATVRAIDAARRPVPDPPARPDRLAFLLGERVSWGPLHGTVSAVAVGSITVSVDADAARYPTSGARVVVGREPAGDR
jgi:hypothetical protein